MTVEKMSYFLKDASPDSIRMMILEINPAAELWLESIDTNLLETNSIDSLNILEIILVIEKSFKINLDSQDIVSENFRTIRNISNFLVKKYGI